jgi:uncharacterized protein YbjT (DUF2867 family)
MTKGTILVSGVTGHQGGATARSLLKRGYEVRGLTRDAERTKPLENSGIVPFVGDLLKPQAVETALRGTDGFFVLTTPFGRTWQDRDFAREKRQAIVALRAAKKLGIGHVVLSSAIGGSGTTLSPLFDSKAANERVFRDLRIPGTIVRPAAFMENFTNPWMVPSLRKGVLTFPAQPRARLELVAVKDIGEMVATAFDRPRKSRGKTIDLTGDTKTMVELATDLGRAAGKTIKFEEQSSGNGGSGFGTLNAPEDPEGELREIKKGIASTEHAWGLKLTSFRRFLSDSDIPRLLRTRSKVQ